MRLVEQHPIRKTDARYATIDRTAFAAYIGERKRNFAGR